MNSSRAFLDELYRIAVAAAHPANCLVPHLPDTPTAGRVILLAAGKAAGSMTDARRTPLIAALPKMVFPALVILPGMIALALPTPQQAVTVNGVPATSFKIVSDFYMTAVIPAGATTGPVVVTTSTGTLTSNHNLRIVQ